MSTLTRFTWRCDACGGTGTVRIAPRVDLWSGAERVLSSHRRTSPTCDGGRDTVRIFTDETLAEVLERGAA